MDTERTTEQPRRQCLFRHKWTRAGVFGSTCTKCGWGRTFTGYDYIWHIPPGSGSTEEGERG